MLLACDHDSSLDMALLQVWERHLQPWLQPPALCALWRWHDNKVTWCKSTDRLHCPVGLAANRAGHSRAMSSRYTCHQASARQQLNNKDDIFKLLQSTSLVHAGVAIQFSLHLQCTQSPYSLLAGMPTICFFVCRSCHPQAGGARAAQLHVCNVTTGTPGSQTCA